MRILICGTEAPLPPLNGMRLQVRELAAALAVEHEVCTLAFGWPEQHGAPPDGTELITIAPPAGGRVGKLRGWAGALASRTPIEAYKLAGPMRAAIADLRARREFDAAHVTIGALADVAPALRGLPAVIAPLDAWHLNVRAQAALAAGPRRLALGVQERLVRGFTASHYRPYAHAVFVTEEDAAAARALDPALRAAVIGNGVDTRRFAPDPAVAPVPGRVLFTGALHAPSNESAALLLAREILPAVRERRPDAHLCLVGRDPGPAVRALAGEHVEVAANVPDLMPWLHSAEVFSCAMTSGTGIKNKLLEALAAGVACVATPLACQGLQVRDGRELRIAEPGPAFAAAVAELLGDQGARARLSAAGRSYVVEHHGWAAVAAAYARLYREAAA